MEENIDILFIIERFGSLEEFRKQYIEALIENLPIMKLNQDLKDCINKYREQLVIGFDITQPNLVAHSAIVEMTLNGVHIAKKTIGNFYNQHEINEIIESCEELNEGNRREWFRHLYGIGKTKKTIDEIAEIFGCSQASIQGLKYKEYTYKLKEKIVKNVNSKFSRDSRKKFIEEYFKNNSIFKSESEMSNEEKERLIELYNRELTKYEMKIDALNLSNRSYLALKRSKIETMEELVECLKNRLKIEGIGDKGKNEIIAALLEKGYNLSELQPEDAENAKLKKIVKSLSNAYANFEKVTQRVQKLEEKAKSMGIKNLGEAIYSESKEEEVEI